MKMKMWLAASMTALAMAAGTMAVSADSLTLSGGEVLDMGSSVSVYPGERSFFGSQLHDWLLEGNAAKTVEVALEGAKVFPKDKDYSKEFSEMAVSILRTGKVYQVRAQADDTFYQGMMVSLSVSDSDMLKLALYGKEAMADRNEGEKIADVKAASSEKAGASENSLDRGGEGGRPLFLGRQKVGERPGLPYRRCEGSAHQKRVHDSSLRERNYYQRRREDSVYPLCCRPGIGPLFPAPFG